MSINSLCGNGTPTVSSAVAPPAPNNGGAREACYSYSPIIGGRGTVPRLLYLASTKSQGGIERHSVELAGALKALGVPLQFACPPGSFLETWCRERGIPTLPFRVRNSGDLGAAIRLASFIQTHKIDIVHAHSRRDYVIAVLGVALARRLCPGRCPRLILHAHMVRPLGSPARLSGRFFQWGADAVVAVSGTVCDHLRRDHDFHPALVHLIYNGIRLEEFARPGSPEAATQRRQARRLWGISEDALVLGMIGRLDAKGQKALLDIFPTLAAKHPSLQIVLIGAEGLPGERLRLTALAEAGGFADRLTFTGPREDVPALLPAFDILVHLPHDEAFGLALAEAMAAGLPTVATRIGGCREVVRDGVSGLLVPPGEPEALTNALLSLLTPNGSESQRTAMGREGCRIVEAEFTRERQIERLLALYQELCQVGQG